MKLKNPDLFLKVALVIESTVEFTTEQICLQTIPLDKMYTISKN